MSAAGRMGIAALAALALCAGGCGDEPKKIVNKGGDTPCNEFVAQDDDKQRITTEKFLEQEREGDGTPDARIVDASIAAIKLMCAAQANPDTPIRKADLTGIFVPK
jgi:acid stress chaperone HdeA